MTVTELPRHATEEPTARPVRWVPARAGILNVWRYYDEVFEFHEGRLLLRGPNGSGKSKALELLLPFLFDASLRANRLSTFGTGERTMHWNLMGEGATGTTRVGYVWLEFRFPGEPERWFTCGARLQASSHTNTVHPDYFTTSLRIGPDGLSLVNEAGQPLTKSVLEERLGTEGVIHGNAGEYRAEVRTTLFPGLNEQRFDALIMALLQLRMPKLSQRLDPSLLSSLLSRALPPLGQQEITELAEGFERLDAQRDRLKALEDEVAATGTLAARQRTYAQRVLRAGAATLISATTELDNLAKAARDSAERYEATALRKEEAERRAEELAGESSTTEARKTGLMESEEYKQGQELDRLRSRTAGAKADAERLGRDAANKRAAADEDELARQAAAQTVVQQAEAVRVQELETRNAAARAGLVSVHEEVAAQLEAETNAARTLLTAAVRSREGQLEAVGKALDSHERAVDRRTQAETDLETARSRLAEAQDLLTAAVAERETALTALGDELLAWVADCRELTFPDPESLLAQLESEPAVLATVDAITTPILEDITRQETTAGSALAAARRERADLLVVLDRLRTEQDLPPAAPPTRTADRTAMTGAPLWRLIDFAVGTPARTATAVEAALEGSGLLDAWVGPRGEVDGHDVFADSDALLPVAGRSLDEVLVAERHSGVEPGTVERLLKSIAFGEELPEGTPAAIGADGSWRLGSLSGSWEKEQASYVGTLARQRARQRRIDELTASVAEYDGLVTSLGEELTALRTRREVIAHERAARPRHDAVAAATETVLRLESARAAAEQFVRDRVAEVTRRDREVARALHELTGIAAEHSVPTDRTALGNLATAIASYRGQADGWLEAHARLVGFRQVAASTAEQARRSAEIASERGEDAARAAGEHERWAATLEAVDSTFGVDYREVLGEIETLRTKLRELDAAQRAITLSIRDLATQLGEFRVRHETDAEAHTLAAARRDAAAHRFRRLATGVFTADSGINDRAAFDATLASSDGVRAALEAARLVAAAWPAVPHSPANIGDALHRLSESVHSCRETLKSRADLDLETDDDVQVFTAVVDGIRVGAAELLNILRTEAEQSRHEITERERQLFDQTLTGDTRRHLAARIRQANELVDGMNARLERVRTASKVAVRLVWQVAPDLPTGTKAARDLLLKDPAGLNDSERESLHRFFRDRIEQAKADDTATSWEQQLAQVFDYTAWHQFVVKVDRANGEGWKLLTRKLHGALSGGEKAIALHLPLFAAVAAHYQAAPEAPRVILLDEVFVGVDTTNRGQVFALLSALDLDLMLTSDHEWCVYSELSGIGIHQLITGSDGDDAVTTARFTWDGHELLTADQPTGEPPVACP
ncbi:TIGR02680 family protein [Amycolatopsis vastitatis]|uniref:TIGR02680 family protein n=1 Tax=Amycolatopsis vastitatis TaxID=1905142 RepID=A0A229T2C6_9PSEU|nr:TIGR02680 family protein [Amycolatopsis vastitatis]OXM65388.1 TIGR02680 family protein [Amycolatopsis vastitatis]